MASRVVLFSGAPETDEVSWDESGLLSHFQSPIASFLGLAKPNRSTPLSSVPGHAVWRSISLEKSHVQTGFSQLHAFVGDLDLPNNNPHFFATTTLSFTGNTAEDSDADVSREVLSEFYEHSLAVHEEIPSSQLVAGSGETRDDTSLLSDETASFLSGVASQRQVKEPVGGYGGGHLSDLEDIPPPAYLVSIQPQTVTVSIIVGVISIAAPRIVKTRWGSTRTLVEVLVGDDTKSGFTVTFWVPSEDLSKSLLAGIRPQDVVLMQNVALTVFMQQVYGSSLRKDLTKVHLLYRKKLDSEDVGGYYDSADLAASGTAHPQLQKTHKVKEWVLQFVGVRKASRRGKLALGRAWDEPPPDDTQ